MSNPNPARIADATWRLWTESAKAIGSVALGGIYANKPGYHATRNDNWSGDYSVQKPADRKGPGDKSAALDITFRDAQGGNYSRIAKYTGRLVAAAKRKDPRLYRGGTPVLREIIGRIDGRARAYDLYARRTDDRDSSHNWHIHLSLTRQFVNDWAALAGIVSILKGEDMALDKKDVKTLAFTDKIFDAPTTWLEEHPDEEDHWTLNTYFRSIRDNVVWGNRATEAQFAKLDITLKTLPAAIAAAITEQLSEGLAEAVAEKLGDLAPAAIGAALAADLADRLTDGDDDSF